MKRNASVDLMRVLGMALIILAHTAIKSDSSNLLFNIRSFDVVMMVFISGLSFSIGITKNAHPLPYGKYIRKRFLRLVVPCLCFVSLYYIYGIILNHYIPNNFLNTETLILSYTMVSGISYVWIVRILFCMALIAPALMAASWKIRNSWLYLCMIVALLTLNGLIVNICADLEGTADIILNDVMIPILGYGIVYLIAIRYRDMGKWHKAAIFAVTLAASIMLSAQNGFYPVRSKYPPSGLYLMYGICCSIFIYELFNFINPRQKTCRTLTWLSANSLTLYFAHIFILYFFKYGSYLNDKWYLQYLILLSGSLILTTVYSYLKGKILTITKKASHQNP